MEQRTRWFLEKVFIPKAFEAFIPPSWHLCHTFYILTDHLGFEEGSDALEKYKLGLVHFLLSEFCNVKPEEGKRFPEKQAYGCFKNLDPLQWMRTRLSETKVSLSPFKLDRRRI